jgi:hypothetical protein
MNRLIPLLLAFGLLTACDDGFGDYGQTQLDHGLLTVDEAVVATHVPCLDSQRDNVLSAADGGLLTGGDAPERAVRADFNADGELDERDAAFLAADVRIDPGVDYAVCDEEPPVDFMVAAVETPAIDCERDSPAVVVVGVAGGLADLRKRNDGAGVRFIVNGLLDELESAGNQALAVIAGPAVAGLGEELHQGMEVWLTHSVRTYLEQFPCAQAVLIGHSHGAVTMDVVASQLEDEYADRIALVVSLDRIDELYFGDTESLPVRANVFNIYETNDPETHATPRDAPNVENWDASGEDAPQDGEKGGDLQPVNHTTIDNSSGVRDHIITEVMERLG